MVEGRRSFLARYADIESGAECERWLPIISAMVDGEASAEQVVELRPHLRNCPGCRATLSALQDSSRPLAAVLPIPFVAATADAGDHFSNLLTRVYEMVAGGLHDRAVTSFTKVQAVVETTAAGKAAAIAGAAAAVAGGGYATVERAALDGRADRVAKTQRAKPVERPSKVTVAPVSSRGAQPAARVPARVDREAKPRTEFAPVKVSRERVVAPEFRKDATQLVARSAVTDIPRAARATAMQTSAPEFASPVPSTSPEFGP